MLSALESQAGAIPRLLVACKQSAVVNLSECVQQAVYRYCYKCHTCYKKVIFRSLNAQPAHGRAC